MTFGVKDIESTRARIKAIIDNYGVPFFQGKSVLDLGAGHGEIGAALARLGATVTCVDARQENLDIINVKHPHLKTIKTDLESLYLYMDRVIFEDELFNFVQNLR